MANIGKIARLPANLRDEVCVRLYNGETSAAILPWLNARKDVQRILINFFNGEAISPQNLSSWKCGEFQRWLERRQKIQDTKELSNYAAELVASGKTIASGGAAILSGKLLAIVDGLSSEEKEITTEEIVELANAISKLQSGEIAAAKLKNDNLKIQHSSERLDLDRKKFERDTTSLFIKYVNDAEAKRIALGPDKKTVKMDKLRELMFGKRPKEYE